jgi:hypothetical protein
MGAKGPGGGRLEQTTWTRTRLGSSDERSGWERSRAGSSCRLGLVHEQPTMGQGDLRAHTGTHAGAGPVGSSWSPKET